MSFAAYTSALLVRAGSGTDWHPIALPRILGLTTLLLLASSVTLETGRRRLAAGRPARGFVAVTLVLGLGFLAGQWSAWRALAAQGLYLSTTPASGFFYLFTALHGLHLVGGLAALGYLLGRVRPGAEGWARGAADAVTLSWHFLGVLWAYLLLILLTRL